MSDHPTISPVACEPPGWSMCGLPRRARDPNSPAVALPLEAWEEKLYLGSAASISTASSGTSADVRHNRLPPTVHLIRRAASCWVSVSTVACLFVQHRLDDFGGEDGPRRGRAVSSRTGRGSPRSASPCPACCRETGPGWRTPPGQRHHEDQRRREQPQHQPPPRRPGRVDAKRGVTFAEHPSPRHWTLVPSQRLGRREMISRSSPGGPRCDRCSVP